LEGEYRTKKRVLCYSIEKYAVCLNVGFSWKQLKITEKMLSKGKKSRMVIHTPGSQKKRMKKKKLNA